MPLRRLRSAQLTGTLPDWTFSWHQTGIAGGHANSDEPRRRDPAEAIAAAGNVPSHRSHIAGGSTESDGNGVVARGRRDNDRHDRKKCPHDSFERVLRAEGSQAIGLSSDPSRCQRPPVFCQGVSAGDKLLPGSPWVFMRVRRRGPPPVPGGRSEVVATDGRELLLVQVIIQDSPLG